MATLRRKKAEPFSVFQRDPGPWPPILLNWMATLAIIMVFGLVMLFSASYTTGYLRFGDSFHYIKSQLLCTVLGLGMMFLFSYFDHRFLRRMVKLGYVVCLILLVLVLFSSPINGCRRWISFGGLTLQASEVAKFEMILLTADIAARTPQIKFGEVPMRKWVHHSIVVELIRPILWLVPVLILLVLEPHMSGILLTTAIVGTILLLGGSGGIITWGCAGAALFLLETLLKHVDSIDYLQSRLDGWTQDLDRMTSQTKQSLYAIGSGGATGLGLGNSIEKQLWLPESTNDFIFSVVCEELGFVGAVIVIVLFVLFLVQGFWIAFHAENRFCTLVGIGIMAQIAWQVFCNIAVVTNTLPNTGISLPFFSSGGTSLILLLAEMGVMVNIGRNVVVMPCCLMMSAGGITIADGAMIAANVQLISNNHDLYERQIITCRPVYIGRNAWIGAGATILPGVTVGDNAVVGAGSVVTRDVEADTIVAGNPARFIRRIDPRPECSATDDTTVQLGLDCCGD